MTMAMAWRQGVTVASSELLGTNESRHVTLSNGAAHTTVRARVLLLACPAGLSCALFERAAFPSSSFAGINVVLLSNPSGEKAAPHAMQSPCPAPYPSQRPRHPTRSGACRTPRAGGGRAAEVALPPPRSPPFLLAVADSADIVLNAFAMGGLTDLSGRPV